MSRFFSPALCLFIALSAWISGPLRPAKAVPTADSFSVSASNDDQGFRDILEVLDGATITNLQTKVSLDGFKLGKGTVELQGLSLKQFDLAVKLKPKAAQKMFQIAAQRLPESQKPPGLFEILKFGVFQEIEIGIHFDELSIGLLKATADDLDVQGLLLQAGINGPEKPDFKKLDSRAALLAILKRAVQKQIEVHAGLQKLSATKINAQVQNVALLGFRVGFSLSRTS